MKFILGPCSIENYEVTAYVADFVVMLKKRFPNHTFVFKASFEKANRTRLDAFHGIGIDEGLEILKRIKEETDLLLTTDIHESWQAYPVSQVVDEIQIPAFLSRQTPLLKAAGHTGLTVNVKKAQWMKGSEMGDVIDKILDTGNNRIQLIERGSYSGNQTFVDFTHIIDMQKLKYPVIFDATHSTQPEYSFQLMKAAATLQVDGIFAEIHPDPKNALSDGSKSLLCNLDVWSEQIKTIEDIYTLG
jgi:2-dehydro-3-deoxyphosphooctonate aldolase (KDO 8-P synthase)